MQDSTDTTRFFRGRTMSLTGVALGAGATVSNARSIEHAHCPIVFGASFLWIERSSLWTTQRAVRLEAKVLSPQVSYPRCASPLRGTEGCSIQGEARGWQRFSERGGQTQ